MGRRPELGRDAGLELTIDRIACDGFGLCAELLPELIELDDWGYPMIRGGAVPAVIPAELTGHARRAASACPVLAIRLARRPQGALVSRAVPERVRSGAGG